MQDVEGEFLRIRDDDSVNEVKKEVYQYVMQNYEKVSERLDGVLSDIRERESIVEWLIRRQLFEFYELEYTQQRVVRRLDRLSAHQNAIADAIGLNSRLKLVTSLTCVYQLLTTL